MIALETIGFSLAVIAFVVGTLVVMMGGLAYRGARHHDEDGSGPGNGSGSGRDDGSASDAPPSPRGA
ncbi:hypothetical protein K7472_09660 [Streptomyces sp. PTM05]|uniref:DUF3149 domain-containing protein n=1 Tax=Streptantibioticus parmotrematis TaxID=2873249 RepID=A0ABS7QPJ3_9ACTN|nr:hypothetical protein [Streptantibioticus parmotrematis]MBY8885110.1 hypothetical protein [Streptantibioticus parmotrematis]